ncbi:HTH-type transcriptional regulator XynR [Baekduia alba]|uniref:IclR family transcriptional regulator n=1 Tax=Baekduia alba TaxID=2997333 RepID=UPI002341D3A8|nr:IclR family transcriptional regulator [Baekduia alba]WCB91791.1 HTH-type transcriptional regulator XynR [Baekduia alba]
MNGPGPAYPIDSVDRALSLILAFEDRESITITEAGKFLGVSRSTAFRLLNVLEHREFVRQDPRTKVFHSGPALLRVGLSAVQRSDIRTALRSTLEEIVREVGETAHLVVLQRNDAFYIDCVEGSSMVRATPRVGTVLPAHVSAAGKVLLANLPPARLDDLLANELVGVTKRSKTSAAGVRRELAKVRKRGWALNDGESEEGLRAVAVLISAEDNGTGVDAAITLAGPAQRLTDERIETVAETMLRIAAAGSRA